VCGSVEMCQNRMRSVPVPVMITADKTDEPQVNVSLFVSIPYIQIHSQWC
jgi:hypothetical protein